MDKQRVSQKAIKPMLEAIIPFIASIRKEVMTMPDCGKKKSLMVTVEALEKKSLLAVKEISEDTVMEYVNKHPEVLQRLAKFAASDKGAVEVAEEVTTPEEVKEHKQEKKKKRF